ncbi:MAG: hypothetical protein GY862_21040, partial [Gammaproteobacteria bacterium]|nr:hypothetical protein [Gammaproteobacteria bacterium]
LICDVFWTREIVTLKRQKFSVHDATMDELFERYRVARLCMDQTGMGEKPVEDAQKRYGEHCVEGVLFTPANKLVPARTGKEHFEDRTCRIPMGDQALRADLHKLKKMDSPAGAPRFIVESDGDKSHADRAWSGFLGLYAGKSPVQKYAYEPVRQSQDIPGVIRATHGFKDKFIRWRNS